ncbi:ABC transporter ATP-binding protein [Shimazuella sp. AN120528]|uniref:ATP-binding cassette domain-containing protein n=1 Tax=Shimazuella soli TaxID=1892854 RepID=UPI001F1036F7|nr:ABC transporter ATP-binding protein [Shimazuella soli]MCH5583868.1 ABC transporter ATP-binding protein [Shimazuella soli]
MNAIECKGLSKQFEKNFALQEAEVKIPENRIIGVLGPNGAGKSTFFRLLVGQIKSNTGEIHVLGQKPSWELNHQIAYLPDRARWYLDYSVEKTIEYGKNFLPGFQEDKAYDLADRMKLDASMMTASMSKGQEAKLMLILCMAREVPLVILDEPFAGIDMIAKEQIMETIIDLASEREQTILISTHEIAETEGLFDYVVFFKEGKVILSGDVEELRGQQGSLQSIYRELYR